MQKTKMSLEKAKQIHNELWAHVSYASLGLGESAPAELEYSLLELCEAEQIIRETPSKKNANGTYTHTIHVNERLIAAIYVANNFETCRTESIVSYGKKHLIFYK